MNLLKETKDRMSVCGKGWDDIDWIGGDQFTISIDNFKAVADIEYDDGFGAQEIASDLVIMFKDGTYFKRDEYDGNEWWTFVDMSKPEEQKTVSALTGISGYTGILADYVV